MSVQRNRGSVSLQELIDSYNDEIMRYSQRAKPMPPARGEPQAGEQARESGEEEIERSRTERDYWLARGKQGLQRMPPMGVKNPPPWGKGAPGVPWPRPEPDEPLYRPDSHMPRPEPDEPLERPSWADGRPLPPAAGIREAAEIERDNGEEAIERGITERKYWQGDNLHGQPMTVPAMAAASPGADTLTEQEQWLRDLEEGLREFEAGLRELEQGLEELRRGEEEYRRALAEREKWLQSASAPPARQNVPENGAFAPQTRRDMPSDRSFAPDLSQNAVLNGVAAPHGSLNEGSNSMNTPSQWQNIPSDGGFAPPMSQLAPQNGYFPPQSNVDAPIAPISPDDRAAQSGQSSVPEGNGTGYLQVGVYTARQTNPLPGATVTVFRPEAEGGGVFASARTNDDGKVPILQVPVGRGPAGSLTPPFSVYTVSVTADGFYPRNELRAQIFDGVTALLWVEMTPLPDGAWTPIQPREGE